MDRSLTPSSGVHATPPSPRRRFFLLSPLTPAVALAVGVAVSAFSACNAGPAGPAGPSGPTGSPSPQVANGENAASCTVPCHGFENGFVSQWRLAAHYTAQNLAVTNTVVLNQGRACGNCHAIDGMERRQTGDVGTAGDAGVSNLALGHLNYATPDGGVTQAGYTGEATSTQIHCRTCHAFTAENDPHVTGHYQQVPLRVPFGDERTYLETSPATDAGVTGSPTVAAYGPGNVCMPCHKSYVDVTFAISPSRPKIAITPFWGPHEAGSADIFAGIGGYRFPDQTYDNSIHAAIPNGCPRCHMPPVAANNNLPDHTFLARTQTCTFSTCHGTVTNFDIAVKPHTVGGQTTVKALLLALRAALCNTDPTLPGPCLLTRTEPSPTPAAPLTAEQVVDADFAHDEARLTSPPTTVTPAVAGALFNYLLVVKSRDSGVHNPIFTQQLLWDSIVAVTGSDPTNIPGLTARPTPLTQQN